MSNVYFSYAVSHNRNFNDTGLQFYTYSSKMMINNDFHVLILPFDRVITSVNQGNTVSVRCTEKQPHVT